MASPCQRRFRAAQKVLQHPRRLCKVWKYHLPRQYHPSPARQSRLHWAPPASPLPPVPMVSRLRLLPRFRLSQVGTTGLCGSRAGWRNCLVRTASQHRYLVWWRMDSPRPLSRWMMLHGMGVRRGSCLKAVRSSRPRSVRSTASPGYISHFGGDCIV